MPSLFVQFEPTGVAVVGRIVPSKVTEREAAVIREEVGAAGPPAAWRVALDLSDVTFLASAGLGALLAINRSCREGGGRLAVFGINPDILGMIKISKLDHVLQISPDRDTALRAFK
jgi:anti-anti-sigma factor